jgi:superfamily II DNA or RNA helicase
MAAIGLIEAANTIEVAAPVILPGGKQALALEWDEGQRCWLPFEFNSQQHEVVNYVFGMLRHGFCVSRDSDAFECFSRRGQKWRFRSPVAETEALQGKTMELVIAPDSEFYSSVSTLASSRQVDFPQHWLLVAHVGTYQDEQGIPRNFNVFTTEDAAAILQALQLYEPELNAHFTNYCLNHFEQRMAESFGYALAAKARQPSLDKFLNRFVQYYSGMDVPGRLFGLPQAQLELWPHQQEALARLQEIEQSEDKDRYEAVIVHPTGSGKTITAATHALNVSQARGCKVLYLSHSRYITLQTLESFWRVFPAAARPCIYNGVVPFEEALGEHDVFLMTCQYAIKHLNDFTPDAFGYIIIDEAHRIANNTYDSILQHFSPYFVLGLTGTPVRYNGLDVSTLFSDGVADRKETKDLVRAGFIPDIRCLRVRTNVNMQYMHLTAGDYNPWDLQRHVNIPDRNELVVNTYIENIENGRFPTDAGCLTFGVDITHAQEMAKCFRAKGIKAEAVHGRMPAGRVREILKDYEDGNIQVLTTCLLLAEGWDSPHTEIILMARPTLSHGLYSQMVGRGLRIREGKPCLWLVDFVDNVQRMQIPCSLHRVFRVPVYRPGAPMFGTEAFMEPVEGAMP